ncbi:uncharacterized protein LOC115874339 isoform X2 [Sitophilus oryzae]|nr:uncharacterized protein LOC115874339 isoform X2 [Sitophilus oryzae]XP_030745318.1 uncharacterized protein LOC115874339 isoform X2 [Sitophilus oryzae]XP_030745319.1 uncharacterized protein LOC115874339 isoform X2 [Sitophilus oryzae]XP_030745320.1 uncharacterized protein LOC115874339 isoform X2 [Sitophilus oryzae]XP_030745321.1 uncharacterized protein LOC115874339 isoform X2 [Sitophilus oryzae]
MFCMLATIVFFCSRCARMKARCSNQFYIIEGLDLSNNKTSLLDIANNFNIYRKYNNMEDSDALKQETLQTDRDLVDSTDLSHKFTNSLLRINSQADDMLSCISTDSLGTFFSTCTANSRRSFVTCSEGSENEEDLINPTVRKAVVSFK